MQEGSNPSFPYVSEYVTLQESSEAMQALSQRRGDQWKFQDYIVDDVKVTAPELPGGKSQYSYWLEHRDELVGMPHAEVRKTIQDQAEMPESLQPGRIAKIIESYGARTVLDPSVGWGETLLAAVISPDVEYTGIVSSPQMMYYCEQILYVYKPGDRCRVLPDSGGSSLSGLPNRSFDMIFVSLSCPEVNRGDVLLTILSSWVKLRPDGVMCLYISKAFKSLLGGEQEISDAIDSFPDVVSHVIEDESVHVWTKSGIYTHSVDSPTITIADYMYDLHAESSHFRALRRYCRALGQAPTHYIAKGHDEVALDLARACLAFSVPLTVYVSRTSKDMHSSLKSANKNCEVIVYNDMYEKKSRELSGTLGGALLPWGLDSPGFVEVMAKVLQEDLADLPIPSRVWLRVDSLTVLRALLKVWTKTTFLCLCGAPFNKSRSLRLIDRHRVMVAVQPGATLLSMARNQGYREDYVYSM